MLSHDEDRQLRAIQQWFEESDPRLSRMLRQHEPPERGRRRRAGRLAVDVTGGLILLFGVIAATAAVAVLGVLVLACGACLHLAAQDTR